MREYPDDDFVWDPEFPEPDPYLVVMDHEEEFGRHVLIERRDEVRALRAAKRAEREAAALAAAEAGEVPAEPAAGRAAEA